MVKNRRNFLTHKKRAFLFYQKYAPGPIVYFFAGRYSKTSALNRLSV